MSNGQGANGTPDSVQVTMYDVGFGDCFLLSFIYVGGSTKRVLIDCGTRNAPAKMGPAVNQVLTDSGGHVDAVVITHRHLDHLSAFGDSQTGPQLLSLGPQLVLQPWTEEPDLDKSAADENGAHVQMLDAGQGFAQAVMGNSVGVKGASPEQQQIINCIAGLSIPNKAALECIAKLAPANAHSYLSAGQNSGLGNLLPGVTVTVLGPPTLTECPAIAKESSSNPSEFWQLQESIAAMLGGGAMAASGDELLPGAATLERCMASPEVRWALNRLDGINAQNVERFVRCLDSAMNNTSLILLFQVGNKVLLFPGDAQWENWSYALGKPEWADQLKGVDLYNVGHHGSGNATPKDLWNLFDHKGPAGQQGRLVTLMSTTVGEYNGVPASTLAPALGNETDLTRSDQLASGATSYSCTL
jgi:beta-lactamase superfamily II metal-dependent hydrolase